MDHVLEGLYLSATVPPLSGYLHLAPMSLVLEFDPSEVGRLVSVDVEEADLSDLETIFGDENGRALYELFASVKIAPRSGLLPRLGRLSRLELLTSAPVLRNHRASWAAEAVLIAHELDMLARTGLSELLELLFDRVLGCFDSDPALWFTLAKADYLEQALQLGESELDTGTVTHTRVLRILEQHRGEPPVELPQTISLQAPQLATLASGIPAAALWKGMRADNSLADDGFFDNIKVEVLKGCYEVVVSGCTRENDALIARLVGDDGKPLADATLWPDFSNPDKPCWRGLVPKRSKLPNHLHIEVVDVHHSAMPHLDRQEFYEAVSAQWKTLAIALEEAGEGRRSLGGRTADKCRENASRLVE